MIWECVLLLTWRENWIEDSRFFLNKNICCQQAQASELKINSLEICFLNLLQNLYSRLAEHSAVFLTVLKRKYYEIFSFYIILLTDLPFSGKQTMHDDCMQSNNVCVAVIKVSKVKSNLISYHTCACQNVSLQIWDTHSLCIFLFIIINIIKYIN